jgi:hypothetical protein
VGFVNPKALWFLLNSRVLENVLFARVVENTVKEICGAILSNIASPGRVFIGLMSIGLGDLDFKSVAVFEEWFAICFGFEG